MQKIVIISRESELLVRSCYRTAIESPEKNSLNAYNLIYFIVEQFVTDKEDRNNCENAKYINSLIDREAPKASASIYRNQDNTNRYIECLANYYLDILKKRNPYITITNENREIIILLWDRVPIVSSGFISRKNRLSLVLNICKDCRIEPLNGNMLYIHDREWGIDKDTQLYSNTMKGEDISEEEYLAMKPYFDSAIAFQHVSVAEDVTTYDLIRHGIFDSSRIIGKVNEIDAALEKGKSFKMCICDI